MFTFKIFDSNDTMIQRFDEISICDNDNNMFYVKLVNESLVNADCAINSIDFRYLKTHDYWMIVIDNPSISNIHNWLKHNDLETLQKRSVIFPQKDTCNIAMRKFTSYHAGGQVRKGCRILKVIIGIGQRSDFALPDLSRYDILEIHVEFNEIVTTTITIRIIHSNTPES